MGDCCTARFDFFRRDYAHVMRLYTTTAVCRVYGQGTMCLAWNPSCALSVRSNAGRVPIIAAANSSPSNLRTSILFHVIMYVGNTKVLY